ncbi:MAG TPA: hypothetical protein VIL20_24345 [Sandaracinaceae bacterium]
MRASRTGAPLAVVTSTCAVADGFDYDGVANSIVFRGPTYRPMIGSEVVVSYRIWGPSVE